jgi:hypothetical protein
MDRYLSRRLTVDVGVLLEKIGQPFLPVFDVHLSPSREKRNPKSNLAGFEISSGEVLNYPVRI